LFERNIITFKSIVLKVIVVCEVSDWLLLNTKWAIFQLYDGQNK